MSAKRRAVGSGEKRGLRITTIILALFCGIGALGGGAMGLISPDGSLFGGETMISLVQNVPILGGFMTSLLLPSLWIFAAVGVWNTVAGILVIRRSAHGLTVARIGGIIIVVTTLSELVFLGSNPLSWIYLVIGIALTLVAWRAGKATA